MTTDRIASLEELDDLLSTPSPALIEFFSRLEGDIIILGIAGKIGMTVGRLAVRAAAAAGKQRRVIGVARFSNPENRRQLEAQGLETIACDLLSPEAVRQLPQVPNVIFMAGRKFGTDGEEDQTWAMNTLPAAYVGEHFRQSRIVAFSTGCVYPLVPMESCGCTEEVPPSPVGEYSQSCLGRERLFQYCARTYGAKVLLFRLNYAIDLRYGVLHDIARAIYEGRPVDNTVGYYNCIWQGDVAEAALRALELAGTDCPALNVTGPEIASTEQTARLFGALMGREVTFKGTPGNLGYLNNAARMFRLFGYPRVSLEQMIRWQANWILDGGISIGKPTHFEVNNGKF